MSAGLRGLWGGVAPAWRERTWLRGREPGEALGDPRTRKPPWWPLLALGPQARLWGCRPAPAAPGPLQRPLSASELPLSRSLSSFSGHLARSPACWALTTLPRGSAWAFRRPSRGGGFTLARARVTPRPLVSEPRGMLPGPLSPVTAPGPARPSGAVTPMRREPLQVFGLNDAGRADGARAEPPARGCLPAWVSTCEQTAPCGGSQGGSRGGAGLLSPLSLLIVHRKGTQEEGEDPQDRLAWAPPLPHPPAPSPAPKPSGKAVASIIPWAPSPQVSLDAPGWKFLP